MALGDRSDMPGLPLHSDRGSKYCRRAFRSALHRNRLRMSRKGNCWNNAMAEGVFVSLKKDLVHQHEYPDQAEARASTLEHIELVYNRFRRQSSLDGLSPEQIEHRG